jgi:hypothetical protein
VARTGVDFRAGEQRPGLEKIVAEHTHAGVVSSSTGELRHDPSAGRFEIDTPRTQGFAGFRSGANATLANATLEVESAFGVVLVSALDERPISASKHWLVSAVGNAVNTGMTLMPSGNRLVNPGSSPVLVEPIVAKVTLSKLTGPLDVVKAYALGASGERLAEVPVVHAGDSLRLELSGAHKTLHYEIVR